jgi:hypothetical protein
LACLFWGCQILLLTTATPQADSCSELRVDCFGATWFGETAFDIFDLFSRFLIQSHDKVLS